MQSITMRSPTMALHRYQLVAPIAIPLISDIRTGGGWPARQAAPGQARTDLAELTPSDPVEKAHPLAPVVDQDAARWIACHPQQHPLGSSTGSSGLTTNEGHFE